MTETILVSTFTVISAIFPDKPSLWNLSDNGHGPEFWESSDVKEVQKVSNKMEFIRAMVGYDRLNDKHLARAAALCQAHVLGQFPVLRVLFQDSNPLGVKFLALIKHLGNEIKVVPLPAGKYKPLAGYLEHQFKHCQSVAEIVALNEEIMARYAELTSQEG